MAIYVKNKEGVMESYKIVGLKGENGVTPNIQIGTVTTLEAGEKATVVNSGTKENPVFDFGIPKGEKGGAGTGGGSAGGSVIITDFEVSGMKEIQPTSLDLSTGIFTCDKVVFEGGVKIIPKEMSISKFPKELILHNDFLKIVKLSETTFKIQRNSSDIKYSTDQPNVDVSDFKFSQGASIFIENINMSDDGVYVIHLHGLRGREGRTNIDLQDKNYTHIISGNLGDGNPISFITTEITITKNKDIYSLGAFVRYARNKTYGTALGIDNGALNSQSFNKTDKKISKLRISGDFVNNTRVWIEKVI